MEQIEWNDSYSVGVDKLDRQHKVIFKIVNRLTDEEKIKNDPELVSDTLDALRQYTNTHFALEESLMAEANYPDLEEHKQRHLEITKKIAILCVDVLENKKTVTEDLLALIKDWWVTHILEEDQSYSGSLKASGLK